ncbi:hypothetical protein D9M71_568520 [compost metagenome]
MLLDLLLSRLAGLVDLQQLVQHLLRLFLRQAKFLEQLLHHRRSGLVQLFALGQLELIGLWHDRRISRFFLLAFGWRCIGRLIAASQIAKQATAFGRRRRSSWRSSGSVSSRSTSGGGRCFGGRCFVLQVVAQAGMHEQAHASPPASLLRSS